MDVLELQSVFEDLPNFPLEHILYFPPQMASPSVSVGS